MSAREDVRLSARFALPVWAPALILVVCGNVCGRDARAEAPAPPEFDKVDVVERPGRRVPMDVPFVDSSGQTIRLRNVFSGERPVVLTLVYLHCPMLCSTVLSGLVRGLSAADLHPGRDVDLVTVSFDPADRPADAAEKRRYYLQSAGLSDAEPAWPFLTGAEAQIRDLADGVGFRYARIAHTSEFAHAAVVFVLTPDGTISRYLYGIDFPKRDLRLAVTEASGGRFGSSFDRFLLHCYRYNPATRRYGFYVSTYFRIGGALILSALLTLIGFVSARRSNEREHRGKHP